MKVVSLILSVYLGTCSCALAQSSGRSPAGSSAGAGGTAAGSSLSNGSTLQRDGRISGSQYFQTPSITARQEIIWAPRRPAPLPMQRLTATLWTRPPLIALRRALGTPTPAFSKSSFNREANENKKLD